jgi:Asparagine synthase
MRDDWFLVLEAPTADGPSVRGQLCWVWSARAVRSQRSFPLRGNRRLNVMAGEASRVIENERYWILIIGPQPPTDVVRRALASARSPAEVRQVCTSVDGEGSSFLIVDKEAGDYQVITDLLSRATVLHAKIGTQRILASNLSLFPGDGLTLDLGGVASYFVNGNCLNNHTIFERITHLGRASVHAFREGGHVQDTYWRFAPGETRHHPWHPAAAAAQLWDLLSDSVDRATRGRRVLLSLSGGYDSSVLLGILGAKLRHPDVTCFSYFYGPPKHRSDAAVARAQAAVYGYEHVDAVGYSGDFLNMLDANAGVGEGLRRPAYEIEAFSHLHKRYTDTSNTVMLFGDECVGLDSYRIKSVDDILGAARLKSPSLLNRFEAAFGVESTGRLRAGIEAEYDILRMRARAFADPDNAKDFIFVDQHLTFGLLPLRTLFGGHWFAVAMPLLSRDVLDFMAGVPTDYRVGKRLFKEMARRFLPDQFRIPRAIESGFNPDFSLDIAADLDRLCAAIVERGWRIDGLLSSAQLTDLLRRAVAEIRSGVWHRRAKKQLTRQLTKGIKTLLTSNRLIEDRQHWYRRRLINQFTEVPEPAYLLVNILCLASTLGDRSAQRWPAAHDGPGRIEPASDPAGFDRGPGAIERPRAASAPPPMAVPATG